VFAIALLPDEYALGSASGRRKWDSLPDHHE
jgi:hypothetical protein